MTLKVLRDLGKTTVEFSCLTCDGAGTLEDKGARLGVRLCDSCNGHGVVLYNKVICEETNYAPMYSNDLTERFER